MLVPFILLIKNQENYWFLALAFIAMATDWMDGYFARKWNQVSELGKILDPLADKINTAGVVIALYLYQSFPLWIAVMIITRDLLIALGALFIFKKHKLITSSNIPGKVAVFFIAISVLFFVLHLHVLFEIALYISIVLIILSITSYLKKFIGLVSGNKMNE